MNIKLFCTERVTFLLIATVFSLPCFIPNASAALADDSDTVELNDVALQVMVDHEVKRQNLAETIETLQKLSGIKLSVAPDCKAAKSLMTARFKGMPLATVLKGISSAFGVSWRKENDAFVMHDGKKTELEKQLVRLGDWDFTGSDHSQATKEQSEAVAAEILQHFDRQQLAEGIKFSDMPEDLQTEFFRLRNEIDGRQIVEAYYKTAPSTIENSTLTIAFPNHPFKDEQTGKINLGRSPIPNLRTSRDSILLHLPIR